MNSPNSIVAWRAPVAGGAVVDVLQSSSHLLQYLTNEERANDGRRPPSSHRKMLLFFVGNPGLVQFYEDFCLSLESNKFDVLVMGYAGHSLTDLNNGRVFTLAEQIDIADSFVAALMNKNTTLKYSSGVYVAGHSIGGLVALHMLARYPVIHKCFGLCPVLSRMRTSPNGQRLFFMDFTLVHWLLSLVAILLALLPYTLRLLLLSKCEPKLKPSLVALLARHYHQGCPTNVLHMARTEYRMLLEPDAALLRSVQDRLALYYVHNDGWVPESNADEIKHLCPRLAAFMIEDDRTVSHTWCLDKSEQVVRNAILKFC